MGNGYPKDHKEKLDALRKKVFRPCGTLKVSVSGSREPVPPEKKESLKYRPILPGGVWAARVYDCAWFHITGDLPADWTEKPYVALINIGGEGLVYANDGTPYEMVTFKMNPVDSLSAERGKNTVRVTDAIVKNGKIDFYMDAGFNGAFSLAPFGAGVLRYARLAERDDGYYAFYYDYLAVLSLYADLPEGEGAEMLTSLNKAYDTAMAGDVAAARDLLRPVLTAGPTDFTLYAVGHSHLDLAWLWPVRETKRKSARTFTKQLNNIEKYPSYIYGASQPWQFEYLKNNQPAIWERIKTEVANGRIEPQGGMYVEADTNISGGEALIRQLYYGKTFFREAFGKEMKICWLPDVFGYNGNLPQILKGAGVPYFFTIKLSWNEHNKFPHRSFNWRGIDGSEVLVHMAPDEDYNSSALPSSTRHAYRNYPEKDLSREALYVYGVGDGGGGPGEPFIELLTRQKTLADTPQVRFSSAIDFFEKLETYREKLPSYQGELYLEKHQGTYTTQGRNKRFNRKTEYALEDLETLCSAAWLKGRPYPQAKLDAWWKEALLYQFHDIIPGSSVNRVYKESTARYRVMLDGIEAEKREALRFLAGEGEQKLVYDPLTFGAYPEPDEKDDDRLFVSGDYMKNRYLSVTFASDGEITSLRSADGTEFAAGRLNSLRLFYDKPLYFNAWDIDWKYHDRPGVTLKAYKHELRKEKSRVTRINYYRHGLTTVKQEVSLGTDDDFVTVKTEADWHELFRMLRAEFLPAVEAKEVACDIQYGTIRRSALDRTPVEKAQFEICAQKYVDVSDGEKGFSLMNDCKYGHRVKEGLVSLSLLRAPVFPDPRADRGKHEFTYALYPHRGALSKDTLARAYRLNKPPVPFAGANGFGPLVTVDNDEIVIELVKKAYRGDALVARLYESQGREASAALTASFNFREAYETDLMEENARQTDLKRLNFRPYEIKTILFVI
ncbi:MAG: alpha-mannosidase [Clostridia bacterium]|nr:alpha-mannosidase [Clostridia bacterium]